MVVRTICGAHPCCFQQGDEFCGDLAQLGTLAVEFFKQTLRLVQVSVICFSTAYISGHEISLLSLSAFRERRASITSIIFSVAENFSSAGELAQEIKKPGQAGLQKQKNSK
jgi:hypothetical protein